MKKDIVQELEREKYESVWADRVYAKQADGSPVVDLAFNFMGCRRGETLIDWGCGCGRPAASFQEKGLSVVGLDIAKNCLDSDVRIAFLQRCLWDLPDDGMESDYAFSTDVLEHIPLDKLEIVIENIYDRTKKSAFIQVCTVLDTFGPSMNPPQRLHLSVLPEGAWMYKLRRSWPAVELVYVGGKARRAFLCSK